MSEPDRRSGPSGVMPLRFFVQLKAHGLADKAGKTVMGIERSTARVFAPADAPLALVVAILEEWQSAWQYSSPEAGAKDIARLRAFVDNMIVE
jgi:hypothetical protein